MQQPLDCNQIVAPPPTFVEFTVQDCEHCIPVHFERQVEKHFNRLAIKTPRQTMTFGALNESANRIAHAILKRRGLEQEPVAVLLAKDAPMVSALLGILKANKIYVPIDITYPAERIQYLLQDLSPGFVLTDTFHSRLLADLDQGEFSVIDLDDLEASLPRENPALPIGLSNLACIIYTSGTTGKPKGVVHDHCGIMQGIRRYTNSLCLSAEDHLALLSSAAHIAGLRDILRVLLNGAMLFPYDVKERGLVDLPDWLNQEQITIYHSIPMVFRQMLENCGSGHLFPSMRLVHLGGGSVSLRDVRLYKKYFSDRCTLLVNLGCTEADSYRQFLIHRDTVIAGNMVPIGYPTAGQDVLLLDEHGTEVGTGNVGEIVVKSHNLAVGYWRNPELTRAVFQPDPTGSGARLYHTGDLGRMRVDGCLEYLGRKDAQVKIRGHRIEPAEIEAALLNLDGIREAAVVAREDTSREPQLVAYVVPFSQPAPTVSALRRILSSQLPDYLVPSTFVWLDRLPLNPNGKVDRRALPSPGRERPTLETAFAAPRNKTERALSEIWARIFDLEHVGIYDNFFELGGYSLLGVRLFTQIEKAFGKTLTLATLFQAPTIEQMAKLLCEEDQPSSSSSLVPIQPCGCHIPFYCVHEYDGNVIYYRDLSRHLGRDQPFYGLQAQGLDGRQTPPTRFEEIAALYVRQIRESQPEGPYFLGGSSLGGLLAFEMAQQLVAQGQKVGLLALFDTWSPGYRKLLARSIDEVVSRHAQALATLSLTEKLAYVRDRATARLNPNRWIKKYNQDIIGSIKRRACRLYLELGRPIPGPLLNFYIGQTMIQASRNYVPRCYPGKVTFFLADQPPKYYHDPHMSRQALIAAGFTSAKNVETVWAQVYPLGWEALAAGGLEIIPVPGSHAQIVREPHVAFLAEKLQASIEKACNEMP